MTRLASLVSPAQAQLEVRQVVPRDRRVLITEPWAGNSDSEDPAEHLVRKISTVRRTSKG